MAKINQKKFYKARQQARLIVANIGVPLFLKAQDNVCPICNQVLYAKHVTVDHVWPLHHTHKNFGNIFLCHYDCNQVKADRLPTQYEIDALAQVNERLGYDTEMDRYQCRQLLVDRYYKVAMWFNELKDRNNCQVDLDKVQLKMLALEDQIGQWINK